MLMRKEIDSNMKWFKVSVVPFLFLLMTVSYATQPPAIVAAQQPTTAAAPVTDIQVMREFKGVRLGMTKDEVKAIIGKRDRAEKNWHDYKLDQEDFFRIHYSRQGRVSVISAYYYAKDRAPAWSDVVGTTEVRTRPNGSKFARVMINAENFWVSMYQSKSGGLTTITISRSNR